jgi:hypothetical protein
MGPFRCIMRSNSGAAAIEFAIVVWALVFVCLGVLEFGRALHVRNELSFAADHAARMILTDPLVTNSKLEEKVRDAISGSEPAGFSVIFGDVETDADGLRSRTMLIEYPFSLLIPTLSDTITLSVSRRVPVV